MISLISKKQNEQMNFKNRVSVFNGKEKIVSRLNDTRRTNYK